MRRIVPLVCVWLFLLTAAESVFAQQRLFVRMASEIVELDSQLPSLGAVVRRFPVPPTSTVVTFGGGQSLVWAATGGIVLFDTFSGSVRRFTFPGFVAAGVLGGDGNARVVVLGHRAQGPSALVADARLGQVHFVDLGPASTLRSVVYASASDVLFVARRRPTDPPGGQVFHHVDVIQAATGALVKTLDISPAYADTETPWATLVSVNAAGTRLFVTVVPAGTFVFDVVSGTPVASNSDLFTNTAAFDELRNRFVTVGAGAIAAYSADSLTFLGKATVPSLPLPPPGETSGTTPGSSPGVSGLSATIFVLESLFTRFADHTACWSQLHALHADTGQVRRTVNMTNTLEDRACDSVELIRITEPAPPPAPTANVSGRQVTLNWRAPFGATQYEVEAGSAPGLANITTINVTDPRLVVDGVPTGTYHVRVRAINTIGKSGASQEVQVIVP